MWVLPQVHEVQGNPGVAHAKEMLTVQPEGAEQVSERVDEYDTRRDGWAGREHIQQGHRRGYVKYKLTLN